MKKIISIIFAIFYGSICTATDAESYLADIDWHEPNLFDQLRKMDPNERAPDWEINQAELYWRLSRTYSLSTPNIPELHDLMTQAFTQARSVIDRQDDAAKYRFPKEDQIAKLEEKYASTQVGWQTWTDFIYDLADLFEHAAIGRSVKHPRLPILSGENIPFFPAFMINFDNPTFDGELSPCVMVTLMAYNLWPYGVPLVKSSADGESVFPVGFVMHDDSHRSSRETYAQQRLFGPMLRVIDGKNLSADDYEDLRYGYHESQKRNIESFCSFGKSRCSPELERLLRENKIMESNAGPVHVVSHAQTAPTTWHLKTGQHILAHLLEMNSSYALCLAHHLTPKAIGTMTQDDIRSVLTTAFRCALISPKIILNLVNKLDSIPEDLATHLWLSIGKNPEHAVALLVKKIPFYMNGRLSHPLELALINKDEAMIKRLTQEDTPYTQENLNNALTVALDCKTVSDAAIYFLIERGAQTDPKKIYTRFSELSNKSRFLLIKKVSFTIDGRIVHPLIILMRHVDTNIHDFIQDKFLKDESISYSQADLDACLEATLDYRWRSDKILNFLFAKGAQYTPSGDTYKYWEKMLYEHQHDRLMSAYANGVRLIIDGREVDLVLWLIEQDHSTLDRFAARFTRQYPPSELQAGEYLGRLLKNHQYWNINSTLLNDLQSVMSDTTSIWTDLIKGQDAQKLHRLWKNGLVLKIQGENVLPFKCLAEHAEQPFLKAFYDLCDDTSKQALRTLADYYDKPVTPPVVARGGADLQGLARALQTDEYKFAWLQYLHGRAVFELLAGQPHPTEDASRRHDVSREVLQAMDLIRILRTIVSEVERNEHESGGPLLKTRGTKMGRFEDDQD